MKKIIVAIACLMILAGISWADDVENAGNEAKYYDNAKVVRIKNIEGEGFVQRSYDEGSEEATPNLPVFEKDTVGTTAGRLGIYLGRLNYLRLDTDTTVQLLGVPQLRRTDLIARVEKGAIYLDIENLDNEKGIEIQTPDCGIFLLDKGIYRINVDENSLTEVFVIEGIAEVAGQAGSRNVRENQKIVMARGQIEERPYYFYASEKDDFDRWNENQNREQGYARYGTSRYLQSGYEDYEYEMSRSGHWTFMPEFNSYVWAPYYSNADWMPYGNGRWVYNPFYGYVWASYDPCGWFTHHYGRWHWSYGGGWYWIPSYHWSPAWVSWFWDDDYYGWCPLSWWDRPVIIMNNRWDRNYNFHHGIPYYSRSTIIIRKNQLTAVNAAQAALRKESFGPTSSRFIAYHGAAPSERPTVAQVSVINARGRTVAYKQNGIISKEKYRISNEAAEAGKSTVYRYNNSGNDGSPYSPRVYRKKDEEKGSRTYGGGYSSSTKTSHESTNSTSSSGEKARSKESKRDDSSSSSQSSSSDSSARARGQTTTSSQSSSSTESEAREAKKKKDEAAYMALLRSENTAGYKSHATGIASNSNPYDAGVGAANRPAYRAYESRTASAGSAAGDFTAERRSTRYAGSSTANAAASGYRSNSYSYQSGYASESLARARSSSQGSGSGSSGRGRAYGFAGSSSASSSHSSHASVSSSTRSWGGSSSSSSHSSSGSTSRAKKR
ncbi:MAG: hypothetical protein NTW95_11520 [Candidatus Aminicenantes bacterium]|nr:hypothetical protein [Candidatus Aminicenantes bacterium]